MDSRQLLDDNRDKFVTGIRNTFRRALLKEKRDQLMLGIMQLNKTRVEEWPLSVCINNIKHMTNIPQSLICVLQIRTDLANEPKQRLQTVMTVIDDGVLHVLSKLMMEGQFKEEILAFVCQILLFEENIGIYMVQAGLLNPVVSMTNSEDVSIRLKVLSFLGNICIDDEENRNAIGQMGLHTNIIVNLCQALARDKRLYDPNSTSPQLIREWEYKIWVLQKYYGYRVQGEDIAPGLTELCLNLMDTAVPDQIKLRSIIILFNISYSIGTGIMEQLSGRIQTLLNIITTETVYVLQLLHLINQLPELHLQNLKPLLVFLEPEHLAKGVQDKGLLGQVLRILHKRKAALEQMPQLHNQTVWQHVLQKNLLSYERFLILQILTAVNLQNVDWLFRQLWRMLADSNSPEEISAALDLMAFYIDKNGKVYICHLVVMHQLQQSLLRLSNSKHQRIFRRANRVIEMLQ